MVRAMRVWVLARPGTSDDLNGPLGVLGGLLLPVVQEHLGGCLGCCHHSVSLFRRYPARPGATRFGFWHWVHL